MEVSHLYTHHNFCTVQIFIIHLCTGIQAEAIDRVLTFPPSNISSMCINFNITDDAVALELPEEYSLELMKPDNPQLQLQINLTRITIVDDDGILCIMNYIHWHAISSH